MLLVTTDDFLRLSLAKLEASLVEIVYVRGRDTIYEWLKMIITGLQNTNILGLNSLLLCSLLFTK